MAHGLRLLMAAASVAALQHIAACC